MCDLNMMLDNPEKVSLEQFSHFSIEVQMQGIEKMYDNEGYISDMFQPWAWKYFKGLKYGDVSSVLSLEDEFDLSIMEMYHDHKAMVQNR
jgi:hypothetical protein